MRIPELQRIMVAAARQQEQGRRGRSFVRRRPLIALIAVLVIGGSAGAAVLSFRGSRPLTGTLPAEFVLSGEPVDVHSAGRAQYSVRLFPFLSVGWTGWCSSVTFTVHGRTVQISYGCGPVERADAVQIQSDDEGGPGGDYMYTIVTGRVATVRYADGVRVKPIADQRLPRWARAAVRVFTRSEAARLGANVPPPRGFRVLRQELLAADGDLLLERPTSRNEAVEHLPLTTLNPEEPADLPCAIHAASLAGLVPVSQTVTAPVSWPRRAPGGFLACANAVYRLGGTNLAAAVLVNALHPDQPAEQLPGLTLDPSHSGVLLGGEVGTIGYPEGSSGGGAIKQAFESLGQYQWDLTEEHNARDHDVSAKRAGGGWLVVEGGTPSQRAALLAALHTNP
jgi:hypothetical protein